MFFEYILIVEHRLKTLVSEYLAKKYGACGYWNAENYTNTPKPMKAKERQASQSSISTQSMLNGLQNKLFAKKQKARKQGEEEVTLEVIRKIPVWEAINSMTLGEFRNFYQYLKTGDQSKICYELKVWADEMGTILYILNHFRNACAHDEAIYNYHFDRGIYFGKNKEKQKYEGVYAATKVLKLLLPDGGQFIEFYSKLNEYMDALFPLIHTLSAETLLGYMGFTKGTKDIFSEMGSYNGGVSLTDEEFRIVVSKYIMPILYGEQVMLIPCDAAPKKDRAVLIMEKENNVYFSQSPHSEYRLRACISHPIEENILGTACLHLNTLMSNIQIVWNSNKARVLNPIERQKLFASNIEIAYQLSICVLLCNRESTDSYRKLTETEFEIRKLESSTNPQKNEKIENLKASLRTNRIYYEKIHELERMQQETLYSILSCFDEWAQKTYEGKHMPFGIIVNRELKGTNTSFSYYEFLQKNYSATISDGSFSSVEISADGRFVRHIKNVFPKQELYTIPYPYQGFALECNNGKIGVILTGEGDVLVISQQKIVFSKHSAQWKYNLHDLAIKYIRNCLTQTAQESELAERLMQTLIDLSYSHGGACVAIAKDNPPNPQMLRLAYSVLLDEDDRKRVEECCSISEQEKTMDAFRISVLNHFTQESKKFHELNTNLRRELLEMDGALLMGCDGKIYAIAAIVKLNGSSAESGARTTAALQLSEYDLAIKVSQDGYMKFYNNREEILTI